MLLQKIIQKMNKKTIYTILYFILIIGLLLFMVWMVKWLGSESAECMRDPKYYYEKKTNTICECGADNGLNYDLDNINLSLVQ